MNLTQLIEQLNEVKEYCDTHGIHTDAVAIKLRDTVGGRHDVDDMYPLISSQRSIVINAKW